MKNIIAPLIALFLSMQLHAAVRTFKFVDASGKEPQEKDYDQQCSLVNCDGNNVIFDNNITLAVGDQLIIQTPKTHSYFYTYRFTINDGTAAASNLKTVKAENSHSDENVFYNFNFRAVAPGVDSFNINFADKVFQAPFCYTPNHLLGNVTLTVIE
ncbi:MAG: hypothetical protein NT164_03015 [Verrucomicrobiae bacterium]|nr:hypothetical protein [Verrucomicrobiae bacterium]